MVLAQRVEQIAEPGGVVIQGAAYETIPGRFPFDYRDLGEHEVKGFDKPVRAYSAELKNDTVIPDPEPKLKPEPGPPDHRIRKTLIALASVAFVAVGSILAWFSSRETLEEPVSVERMKFPLPDKPSIAVLPFTNMSKDEEQEYFVDGMTEDLITDLSKLSGLFVIARNSVFAYKDEVVEIREVAEELGVRYVMEGSVRRVADQVRINAQLIDATTGGHLWAERYDGSLDDVFALQDQVTEKIVTALAIELTPREVQGTHKGKTRKIEAYDEYLKGQDEFRRGTPAGYLAAVKHFERAVASDPSYGLAYAALAAVYWNSARNGWSTELGLTYTESSSQSREYLREAMKTPSPLAHQVASERASHLRSSPVEAISEAEAAIELDANDPAGHLAMANALIKANQPELAVTSTQRAMRLDPHYPASYLRRLGRAQLTDLQFEAAVSTLENAIHRNPEDEWAMVFLVAAYGHLGLSEKAMATIERLNSLRNKLGRGNVTWENVDVEMYMSRSRYTGMLGDRDVIREGLNKAGVKRGFEWISLISTVGGGASDTTHYEVSGATNIDVETALLLYQRGVPFVETITRSWLRGHIPGAHLMEWFDGEFNEQRLSQLVDKNAAVVITGMRLNRRTAEACASAVAWGFRKVNCFMAGISGWRKAGYPIQTGN